MVIESKTVNVQIEFCAEIQDDGDIWYFHRFSNDKERELGGSYDRELAFKRYQRKLNKLTNAVQLA